MNKIVTLLIISTLLISCSKDDRPSRKNGQNIDESVIEFGFDLLKESIDNDENVLLSPYSVYSALGMTLNGTETQTFDEMKSVLHIAEFSKDEANASIHDLTLNIDNSNKFSKLEVANAIFHDPDRIVVNGNMLTNLSEYYLAENHTEDFSTPEAVETINNWTNEKTEGRIPTVLENISSDEAMFLINALYFLGDWEIGFIEELTSQGNFTQEDGTSTTLLKMTSDDIRSQYIGDDFAAVDLKIKGGEYAMTFVLPDESISAVDFITDRSAADLSTWYTDLVDDRLQDERVMVWLPKFELKKKIELKPFLSNLGMATAFTHSADFTSMGQAPGNIFLTRVLHDVFLKVDEKGVEGAAVTTVGVGVTSVPSTIDFNRPFLFILRHVESKVPIFIGKIGHPF